MVNDDVAPFQGNVLSISSPKRAQNQINKAVTLLYDENCQLPLANSVELDLMGLGYAVERRTIHDDLAPKQDIVSVLDLEHPVLKDITEEKFQALLRFLRKVDANSGILWCTRASQVAPKDPSWAQSLGFARTVRNELAIDLATLELDDCREEASEAIVKVLHKFQNRTKDDAYDSDFEWVLDNNKIKIGRFHWFSVNDELSHPHTGTNIPRRLEIGKPGLLSTLGWAQLSVRGLASDEVEVEVQAAGMNFKVSPFITEGAHRLIKPRRTF